VTRGQVRERPAAAQRDLKIDEIAHFAIRVLAVLEGARRARRGARDDQDALRCLFGLPRG
jgi:hypothetical protein